MRYQLRYGRKNSPNPYYVLAGLIFVVIIGMNLYLLNVISRDKQPPEELANSTGPSMTQPLPENLLSLDKVRGLAHTDSPDNEITGMQLEQRNGQLVYLVTLSSGKKLAFDAQSGQRLADNTYNGLPNEKNLPSSLDTSVDFEMAREVAKGVNPDGTIVKIELGQEADAVVYSVYFTDNNRVDVASDGTILRRESASTTDQPAANPADTQPAEQPAEPSGNDALPSFLENPNPTDNGTTNP